MAHIRECSWNAKHCYILKLFYTYLENYTKRKDIVNWDRMNIFVTLIIVKKEYF